VGVGNIGRALLTHSEFQLEGFNISMAFDNDPKKVGTRIGSVVVQDMESLPGRIESEAIDLAILAVPESAAPKTAEILAAAGISSILSFSPCDLCMPPDVRVTCVDLGIEMARLLYHSRFKHFAETTGKEG
jgi:redox-sensing transcriptional repressor